MKTHVIRRARPLLGTFVEITARGRDAARLERAVGAAFATIERLQARLNVHDPASEVSRLNCTAQRRPMAVSGDTWRLLRAAKRMSLLSAGAFDVTAPRARGGGDFRDIALLRGRRVRFARTLRVDLGGIAKGYCVDRAVAALARFGVRSGLVNAGGDLRAFGAHAYPLQLRHPADPRALLAWGRVRNAAVATSARYRTGRDRWAGALVHGCSGAPIDAGISVSVRAERAWVADALTKVVMLRGAAAADVLARYRARAWVLGTEGGAPE